MTYAKPILCAFIVLAGCGASAPKITSAKYEEPQVQKSVDRGPLLWRSEVNGDYLNIFVDEDTGCEYITLSSYKTGAAITPRIGRNGRHICEGNPNE